MLRSFIKRRFLSRGVWFQRKSGVLLENWQDELRIDLTFLVGHLLQRRDPLTFVQVGAYDGVANDPLSDFIRRGKLRGVLVEPQPDAFVSLRQNYQGISGLAFENCAIGDAVGRSPFYRVKEQFEPLVQRSRQMSGFSSEVLLKHYRAVLADPTTAIETIEVPTVTLTHLLEKHGLETLDLLQIDAEGHDYAVLKAVDFSKVRPAIIGYETANLSRDDRDRSYALLLGHGYLIYEAGHDCLAYHRSVRESAPGALL